MSTLKEAVKSDKSLDVRGMGCPMPLIKAKKMLETIDGGMVLEVLGTDPGSKNDFANWAAKTGNEYLGCTEESGFFRHLLRKKAG